MYRLVFVTRGCLVEWRAHEQPVFTTWPDCSSSRPAPWGSSPCAVADAGLAPWSGPKARSRSGSDAHRWAVLDRPLRRPPLARVHSSGWPLWPSTRRSCSSSTSRSGSGSRGRKRIRWRAPCWRSCRSWRSTGSRRDRQCADRGHGGGLRFACLPGVPGAVVPAGPPDARPRPRRSSGSTSCAGPRSSIRRRAGSPALGSLALLAVFLPVLPRLILGARHAGAEGPSASGFSSACADRRLSRAGERGSSPPGRRRWPTRFVVGLVRSVAVTSSSRRRSCGGQMSPEELGVPVLVHEINATPAEAPSPSST